MSERVVGFVCVCVCVCLSVVSAWFACLQARVSCFFVVFFDGIFFRAFGGVVVVFELCLLARLRTVVE